MPPHDEEPDMKNKSINVWGYITQGGHRGLVRYKGTMKGEDYLKLLQQNIRNAIPKEDNREDELKFMHDGASYHTAKDVEIGLLMKSIKLVGHLRALI